MIHSHRKYTLHSAKNHPKFWGFWMRYTGHPQEAYNLECKHKTLEADHYCDWSELSDDMKQVWWLRGVSIWETG